MRKLLISFVLGMAAACSKESVIGGEVGGKVDTSNLAEMTLDDVDKGLASNTLTAVDCNGDGTRKKFGALPNAIMISDDEAYAPSELPADKTRKLVFYCSGPS
jgi:hypothetical protein